MQQWRFLTIGLFITFLGVQLAVSQEHIFMPTGFSDLQPGMIRNEFLSIRTNAQPFSLFPEHTQTSTRPSEMYIEHIKGHPFFDNILYSFQTNILYFVGFVGKISTKESNKRRTFLNELLSEWGNPDQYAVVELDEGKGSSKSPAVIWQKKDLLIAAAFTSDKRLKVTGKGSLQLKIQKEQYGCTNNVLNKIFIVPKMSQKERDAILAPVRNIVEEWLLCQQKNEDYGSDALRPEYQEK